MIAAAAIAAAAAAAIAARHYLSLVVAAAASNNPLEKAKIIAKEIAKSKSATRKNQFLKSKLISTSYYSPKVLSI